MGGGFKCDECTGNHLKNNFQANHFDDSGSRRRKKGGEVVVATLLVACCTSEYSVAYSVGNSTVTSAVCSVLHMHVHVTDGLCLTQSAGNAVKGVAR